MGVVMPEQNQFEVVGSRKWLINFYQERLDYFKKIGVGNKLREFNMIVSRTLLKATKRRLNELTLVYEVGLTSATLRWRKNKLNKEKLSNGSTNDNGTTIASRVQNNGSAGHKGDE